MPTGTIKNFNGDKGYGFIMPQGGGADVFVHISAVKAAGLTEIKAGQKLKYELDSSRGRTCATSLELVEGISAEDERISGVVKWFDPGKRFGFIKPTTGGKDVFVHISAVERAGLESLAEGQSVSFMVGRDRGRDAAMSLQTA